MLSGVCLCSGAWFQGFKQTKQHTKEFVGINKNTKNQMHVTRIVGRVRDVGCTWAGTEITRFSPGKWEFRDDDFLFLFSSLVFLLPLGFVKNLQQLTFIVFYFIFRIVFWMPASTKIFRIFNKVLVIWFIAPELWNLFPHPRPKMWIWYSTKLCSYLLGGSMDKLDSADEDKM